MAASLCPCGEEPLDAHHGMHTIGVRCRELVVRHVRRRFGPHRFAGRYAAEVEDIVQECYQKLLARAGVDSFQPDPARKRSDAFRAWLWHVIHFHCNNKADYFRRHPEVAGCQFDNLPETHFMTTPEQEFARTRLRELNERAVEAIEQRWQAKGAEWVERFDVVLSLVYGKEADSQRARDRLGVDDVHLRVLKSRLTHAIRRHVRTQICQELALEPDLGRAAVERAIDREIAAMFQTAYPTGNVRYVFWNEDDSMATATAEPDLGADLEPPGVQPEATS